MHSKRGQNPSIQEVIDLLTITNTSDSELLIVKLRDIQSLISTLSPEQIRTFLGVNANDSTSEPQNIDSICDWMKAARIQLGLTQRGLALRLREMGLKIHGSDIGNIETKRKLHLYRRVRLDAFRSGLKQLLSRS